MIEGTDKELQISCLEQEVPQYFPGDSQPKSFLRRGRIIQRG